MIYKYKWDGELKKRQVPESFKQWDEVQQIQFLTDAEKAEEERGFWGRTGSATLDALALLERPAQGLKVGLREMGLEVTILHQRVLPQGLEKDSKVRMKSGLKSFFLLRGILS